MAERANESTLTMTNTDIYGTRAGRGQIPKDKEFFIRPPGQHPSILGTTTCSVVESIADNSRASQLPMMRTTVGSESYSHMLSPMQQ